MKTKYMREGIKILFNQVAAIGEVLSGDLHIIDHSYPGEDEKEFRVYHKEGYCFDVGKHPDEIDETGKTKTYYYDFYQEWEGFDKITLNEAIRLLKKYKSPKIKQC